MAVLSVELLGGFQARVSGSVVTLPTRKAQALLAYLALPPGQAHPRDKLASLLWGGIRQESARASLRQALFSLRRALRDTGALTLEGHAVALDAAVVDTDVSDFTRATADGTPEALARAADLYRGDLLTGLVVDEAPWEEWLLGERERLRELVLETLAKLLVHRRRSGAVDAAAQTAVRLLTLDPLQESVHRTLMRLYADLGRRAAALRQYQQCVTVLRREFGTEPEPETKQLYEEILRARLTRARPAPSIEPVVPGETRGGHPGRARHEVTPSVRASAPLVGRIAETAVLGAALDRAVSGQGSVVAVLGDAGVGKSRIVAELAATATARRVSVLTGRAYESEQILAFGPWVDALRAAHIERDALLLERLAPAWHSELARLLPELGAPPSENVESRRLFEAILAALGRLAAAEPLLLILEDLHWADDMTCRLLGFVGRRLADLPLLVAMTARADELDDAPTLNTTLAELQRDGHLVTVALVGLSRRETHELVRALTPAADDQGVVAALCDHAWAVSEGNPFVAVEAVQAATDGPAAVSRALAIPERVRDIVGRRLARLSERARRLADVAAVIGRAFDFALLHRASGLDEADAASGVEELVRRGLLHGVGERFDFTHDRIREVAYGAVLGPRRRLLHRRVAEAIEERHGTDPESHRLAIGLHYRDAGVWSKALEYLERAGRDAQTVRSANREALACYDGALTALGHLPADATRTKRQVELLIHAETALMGLGDFPTALARLREAETLARTVAEPRYLGLVQSRLTYHLASTGDFDGAVAAGEQALARDADEPSVHLRAGTRVVVARAHYGLGDYRRALDVTRLNDELAAEQTDPQLADRVVGSSSVWAIVALAELGEFTAARALSARAVRAATEEAGLHGTVWGHVGVGRLLVVQGEPALAVETLEPIVPLCEVGGDLAVYFSRTASSLGLAWTMSGRVAEGVALLQRAADHAGAIGFAYAHALVVGMLGEAFLLAGNATEAARRADEAAMLARKYGQRGWEAWALRLRAECALAHGASGAAAARFTEAIGLAEPRGMRPLLVHCRLGLGQVRAAEGDLESAFAVTRTALEEYRAMAMPYWIARAARELDHLCAR